MATISRRRRQPAQREEIPLSIFDALNAVDPNGRAIPKEGGKAAGPTIEDLQKQLAAMNERVEAAERVQTVITNPVHVDPAPPKEPVFNLEGLPDPMASPEAYAKEMGARQQAYSKSLHNFYQEQDRANQSKAANYNQLWTDFATQNDSYAADMEGVEFATNKVRKTLERKGVDVNRYMLTNTDRFFSDITKAYDARFGAPEGDDLDVRQEPTQRPRQPAQRRTLDHASDDVSDQETQRTGGIFGGIDSGGNRAPPTPPPGDMIKDLQDIQRKMGYYG